MEKKIVKYTDKELKKMKGITHWAALVKSNKTPKPNSRTQRT